MIRTGKSTYSHKARKRYKKDPNRLIRVIVHEETTKLLDAIAEETHWQKPAIVHLALLALANYQGEKKPPTPTKKEEQKDRSEVSRIRETINELFEKYEGKG